MCQSCRQRALKLRELVERFEELAAAAPERIFRERLERTAADLAEVADHLSIRCEAAETLLDDVIWDPASDEDVVDTAPRLRIAG